MQYEMFKKGLGSYSLCIACNRRFGQLYVPPFLHWNRRGLEYRDKLHHGLCPVLPYTIQPLAVIKQIAVSSLAMAHPDSIDIEHFRQLRRFVMNEWVRGIADEFAFFVYFAGVDTPRFCKGGYMMDTARGGGAFVYSEFAFPPFGYVVVPREDAHSHMIREPGLCEVTRLGDVEYLGIRTIHLKIPVVNNVGPGALSYAPTKTGWPIVPPSQQGVLAPR